MAPLQKEYRQTILVSESILNASAVCIVYFGLDIHTTEWMPVYVLEIFNWTFWYDFTSIFFMGYITFTSVTKLYQNPHVYCAQMQSKLVSWGWLSNQYIISIMLVSTLNFTPFQFPFTLIWRLKMVKSSGLILLGA